jgi:hypothetical protein
MSAVRLSGRRLAAIEGALAAMLAGAEGEGDWPEGVTFADMEAAHDWVMQKMHARDSRQGDRA